MDSDVMVVGAGIAGLTCAKRLAEAGRRVVVLEKSRGVGGRCATRRVEGTWVDHGLSFFHGSDEMLRSSIESAASGGVIAGWPRRIRGTGSPCQPSALRAGEWRLACSKGMTVFPKHLATGLDIRLNWQVVSVEPEGSRWRIVAETGQEVMARDLALCVPPPQALELTASWSDAPREFESLRWLLGDVGFVSTLTVIALYPEGSPVPDWDMWYPEESGILQLVGHDSSKRLRNARTTLLLQAMPEWSSRRWERPRAEWSAAMLEEVGRLAGPWAAGPQTMQTHRWRFARIGSGGDLAGPVMIALPEGRRLGFAGDSFFPGGGVQAAWRSGLALAQRLLEGQTT
jgi:predicted NAD/FAD-dependent oxidoreductase